MASFRNRDGKWQARVRRQGENPVSNSFLTLHDAERWARQIETDMDKGIYTSVVIAERTTFREIIERYMREVTPTMLSAREDLIRLRATCRKPICNLSMLALTPSRVAEYRDERLQEVSAGTVIRELSYFSSIINHARREWGINTTNPVTLVRKPSAPRYCNTPPFPSNMRSRLRDARIGGVHKAKMRVWGATSGAHARLWWQGASQHRMSVAQTHRNTCIDPGSAQKPYLRDV